MKGHKGTLKKRCKSLNSDERCKNGFYPYRQAPMCCRGFGNLIPECVKDDLLPLVHDGHGRPIMLGDKEGLKGVIIKSRRER